MSLADDELAKAEMQAAESRRHLAQTVAALQNRLKPSALARDAVDGLKDFGGDLAQAGIDTVKRHPLSAMGVIAAVTAFLTRKPLHRLFRRPSTDRLPDTPKSRNA